LDDAIVVIQNPRIFWLRNIFWRKYRINKILSEKIRNFIQSNNLLLCVEGRTKNIISITLFKQFDISCIITIEGTKNTHRLWENSRSKSAINMARASGLTLSSKINFEQSLTVVSSKAQFKILATATKSK
jgi:hypothetical protein